jgi:hypothetical protein
MVKIAATIAALLAAVSASPIVAVEDHNGTVNELRARATSFWYANMDHTGNARGYAPDLDGDFTYPVFVAVSPGAGAAEIQAAINSDGAGGSRHPLWFASQPRVVYIPPGTYTINQTIYMNTDTILMGDATNPPTLKAAAGGFSADATLVSGQDPATGIMGELSFAVGLKNLILDTTAIPGGKHHEPWRLCLAFVEVLTRNRQRIYSALVGSCPSSPITERQNHHGVLCQWCWAQWYPSRTGFHSWSR